ncbi:MAG: Cna B-type domain-containing protein [Lachnospiraceae bacterium]|nr:Cna B-type domain-containing protein [Lachnospiraceae bacterium]
MKSKTMKFKKLIAFGMTVLTVFTGCFGASTIQAEAAEEGYSLNFEVSRAEFSDYENLTATYMNYWLSQPKNDIFNKDKWDLNDFSVEHELHIEGQADTVVKKMAYSSANSSWDAVLSFDNIKIPYDKIEVQYYEADKGGLVEPYLLHYNLYLKKSNDKMVLSIPKLSPREDYENPTGAEKILTVNNINIKALNSTIKTLYLNGQAGDDSLDGTTPEKAVKTFEKAKALAVADQNINRIIVIGTAEIQGEVTLTGTNAQILRGEKFNGYLFSVGSGKAASLSNIVVDGNSAHNSNIEKSLIEVRSQATLNIASGANLKNNYIKAIKNTSTNGGAVYATRATINMTGGNIENNQATYGGGVHLNGSTMNFSGGIVQNNRADLVIDRGVSPAQFYSAGGGIIANEGSSINMSADAKVLNNYAKEIGGGISLGSNQWGATNILKMSGGTVEGNTAGSAGGGIFVQAKYFSGGASKAYIDSGKIINNQMDASGYTEKMFGGGGIYVNGANNNYGVNGANGELHLKNVVIHNNESKYEGAGFAACPISKTKIHVTNGGAIYGNKTGSKVNEIYILCNKYLGFHGGNPEYDISKRMLGGVLYKWKNNDNSLLSESKHKGILDINNEYLGLHTDEKGNELTSKLASVYISGNKSNTRGGGIGSNGSVTIGTEETTSVSVEKKWVHDNSANQNPPEFVTVKLIAGIEEHEYEIETKQLGIKNNWKATFNDLPTKINEKEVRYFIREESVEGYTGEISGTAKDGFTVTNTAIPQKTSIQVTKSWEDENDRDGQRPNSVTIRLLADGKEVSGKTLTLTKANHWTGSFTDLDEYRAGKKIEYTVKEEAVGNGYTSMISGNEKDGFTVTNTREPEKTSVEGLKIWDDQENQDGKRPDQITINLLKNGEKIASKVVKQSDDWKWTFAGLDKYEGGKEITYSISEERVEGYSAELQGYSVKNSYTPQKTSIQVTKSWEDENDRDGQRPNSVTIRLLADGKEVSGKTLTLTKANHWTGSFTDLDEYRAGKKIEYTVKEEAVGNGYTSIISGSAETGYVVTNIKKPNMPPEKPNKKIPPTGDGSNLCLYGGMTLIAGGLLVFMVYRYRKHVK